MTALPPTLAAALADRYRIERELGAGGMSMVYLAQDLKHDRRVAFKVLVMPSLTAPLADCYRLEQELGQGGMATLYPRMALHVEVIHQRLRGAAALSSLG